MTNATLNVSLNFFIDTTWTKHQKIESSQEHEEGFLKKFADMILHGHGLKSDVTFDIWVPSGVTFRTKVLSLKWD